MEKECINCVYCKNTMFWGLGCVKKRKSVRKHDTPCDDYKGKPEQHNTGQEET